MVFKISPAIEVDALNKLFSESWDKFTPRRFDYLKTSLFYIYCYDENELIGFVNIVSDGYLHAFVLDVTVRPKNRKNGIGTMLVHKDIEECKEKGIEWVHVDFEENLEEFYRKCGFKSTKAGLISLIKNNIR